MLLPFSVDLFVQQNPVVSSVGIICFTIVLVACRKEISQGIEAVFGVCMVLLMGLLSSC